MLTEYLWHGFEFREIEKKRWNLINSIGEKENNFNTLTELQNLLSLKIAN